MKTRLLLSCLLAALLPAGASRAGVVRPAPPFGWVDGSGKVRPLSALRGKPVVVVMARSARSGALRKQVKRIEEVYRLLAARGAVFVAALEDDGEGPAGSVRSDIPFVYASDGAGLAGAYGVDGAFALAVIGPDGNLDLISDKVVSGERVRVVVINTYEAQKALRRDKKG